MCIAKNSKSRKVLKMEGDRQGLAPCPYTCILLYTYKIIYNDAYIIFVGHTHHHNVLHSPKEYRYE